MVSHFTAKRSKRADSPNRAMSQFISQTTLTYLSVSYRTKGCHADCCMLTSRERSPLSPRLSPPLVMLHCTQHDKALLDYCMKVDTYWAWATFMVSRILVHFSHISVTLPTLPPGDHKGPPIHLSPPSPLRMSMRCVMGGGPCQAR